MYDTSVARGARLADSGLALIVTLLIVDSLHFVFARILLPLMAPTASALYVLGIGTIQVGLFGLATRRIHLRTFMQQRWFFLAIGFMVAASTVLNYTAVALVDPGTASLLSKTSLIFGVVIGVVWLRERLSPGQIGGALLAVAGVAIISFQPGDYTGSGAMMVLTSALLYALHAAIAKRYGGEIDFMDFF